MSEDNSYYDEKTGMWIKGPIRKPERVRPTYPIIRGGILTTRDGFIILKPFGSESEEEED
jgi:hypothetical protein